MPSGTHVATSYGSTNYPFLSFPFIHTQIGLSNDHCLACHLTLHNAALSLLESGGPSQNLMQRFAVSYEHGLHIDSIGTVLFPVT